jgi:uncharacterized membrane protein
LLLGIAGLLAAAFAVVIPPFQVCDEHAHFVRAFDISLGHFVGEPLPKLPAPVAAVILRYPETLEMRYKIKASDVAADIFRSADVPPGTGAILADDEGHKYLTAGILAANIYCPIAYLPASAGIWTGRLLGLPPLALLYAGRFGDVLLFVLALALVFRLAPEHRLMFAAVALLPMTLHQAGGVTADAMTIALSFVAVACLLWLRQNRPDRRSLILIAVLFAAWVVCKISPWAFLAILLIPRDRFASRRAWIGYMSAVAAGMVVAILVWQLASYGSLDALRVRRLESGIDTTAHVKFIVTQSVRFAVSAAEYCVRHASRYAVQFAGGFGWSKSWMPVWFPRTALLLLIIVAATEAASKPFSPWERVILVAVFLISTAFLHTIIYVTDGFDGVQGRYFIPFCFFGLLAIRQNKLVLSNAVLGVIVVATGVIHGIASLAFIWGRHYL